MRVLAGLLVLEKGVEKEFQEAWVAVEENGVEGEDDIDSLGVSVRTDFLEEYICLGRSSNELGSSKSVTSRKGCDREVVLASSGDSVSLELAVKIRLGCGIVVVEERQSSEVGGVVAGPQRRQGHDSVCTVKLDRLLLSETNDEQGADRRCPNRTKVDRKTEHRVGILNGPVVGVLGVGKLSVGGKVGSNRGVCTGLVSEIGHVLCRPVIVAVVGLIGSLRKGQLSLPVHSVVSSAAFYGGGKWCRAGARRLGILGHAFRLLVGSICRRHRRHRCRRRAAGCVWGNTIVPLRDSVSVSGNPFYVHVIHRCYASRLDRLSY